MRKSNFRTDKKGRRPGQVFPSELIVIMAIASILVDYLVWLFSSHMEKVT
jgi:hypothetical protein